MFFSSFFQYHALGLLYHIRKYDRLAVTKLVSKFSKHSLKSPYAYCLLVSIFFSSYFVQICRIYTCKTRYILLISRWFFQLNGSFVKEKKSASVREWEIKLLPVFEVYLLKMEIKFSLLTKIMHYAKILLFCFECLTMFSVYY